MNKQDALDPHPLLVEGVALFAAGELVDDHGLVNGPEHYTEAERCLDEAKNATDPAAAAELLARAHVHATLALAAATSLTGPAHERAWKDATSVRGVNSSHGV